MNIIKKTFCFEDLKAINKNEAIKTIFIIVVLGFVIHGTYAFDKTIWFDDATSTEGWAPWAAVTHGRWMWGIIDHYIKKYVGTELIASWHIINSFIIIAIMALLLLELFKVKNKVARWSLIIYMIVNITVLGNIGYVGSSAMNFLGILFALLAAVYTYYGLKSEKVKVIPGILFLTMAIGMYQCYLAFYVSMILLMFVGYIIDEEQQTIRNYFFFGMKIIVVIIVSLILYFIANNMVSYITGIPISDYAGTSSYGVVDVQTYIDRFVYAYSNFFIQYRQTSHSLFPFTWGGWWYILLALILSLSIIQLICFIKEKEYNKAIAFLLIVSILPLANNLTFLMYDIEVTHSLHVYQSIFIFYYVIVLAERLNGIGIFRKKVLLQASIIMIIIFDFLLIKYDNQCYVSIKLAREKSNNYMSRLISDVHSTPGYVEGMKICVAHLDKLEEKGVDNSIFGEGLETNPFFVTTFTYTLNDYIRLYNDDNFYVSELEEDEYEIFGINSMPEYPSYGSIQIIYDIVIINM